MAVLPGNGAEGGRFPGDRLVASVEELAGGAPEGLAVTVPVGGAILRGDEDLDGPMSRPDEKLLAAKAQARNRLHFPIGD